MTQAALEVATASSTLTSDTCLSISSSSDDEMLEYRMKNRRDTSLESSNRNDTGRIKSIEGITGRIMATMTITTGDNSQFEIALSWLDRWDLPRNLHEELGSLNITWIYTSTRELSDWIRLNKMMDEKDMTSPILISQVWSVIRLMDPSSDEFLLYTHINRTLPDSLRAELYRRLGSFIRSLGVRPPYASGGFCYTSIHNNLNLYRDLAYGVVDPRPYSCPEGVFVYERSRYNSAMTQSLSNPDLNTVTGIVHTAWQEHVASGGSPLVNEIPWDLIRWNDVVRMAPAGYAPSQVHTLALSIMLKSNQEIDDAVLRRLSEVDTGERNLRLMLAGRDPVDEKVVLMSSRVDVVMINNVPVLNTSSPALLLERLLQWVQKTRPLMISSKLLEDPHLYSDVVGNYYLLDATMNMINYLAHRSGLIMDLPGRSLIIESHYSHFISLVRDSMGDAAAQLILLSCTSSN